MKFLYRILKLVAITLGVLLAIEISGLRISKIHGSSMFGSIKHGQYVVSLERWFTIDRQDIVVVYADNKYLCKRIIGMPNDHIIILGGIVIINGIPLEEPYLYTDFYDNEILKFTLEDNEFFIMGDARNISFDGRIFGPVLKEQIIGEVILY